MRAAFGGRTVTFRPPADKVSPTGVDGTWLQQVRAALAPLGVADVEVSSASLEEAFMVLSAEDGPEDAGSEQQIAQSIGAAGSEDGEAR